MKKFGLIALLSILTFGLTACGGNSTTNPGPVEAECETCPITTCLKNNSNKGGKENE